MTRAALALLFFASTAHAGDSVPAWVIWPPEPAYLVHVHEDEVIGPLWPEPDDAKAWAVLRAWFDGPDVPPAPVPLPPAGLMLTAALGLLWRMKHE